MEIKKFGKTEKEVFILGLGTFGHGDAYGGIGKDNSLKVMQHVMDKIPDDAYFLIDTAPKYGSGDVECWIGDFIKKSGRKNILIATKGGRHIEADRNNEKDFSSEFLRTDLANSLRRLNVDKVFLYQLHNPDIDITKNGKVFHLLESFRTEGKIEWYGISIDKPEEGIAAIEYCGKNGLCGLASIQVIYNVLQKKGLDALFQLANKHKIAIIARETLLRGFLADKYTQNTDFSNASEAVKKEISLFGKEQILSKIDIFRKILTGFNINLMIQDNHISQGNFMSQLNSMNQGNSMNQFAIKFVVSNPHVTIAIPGINRLRYVESDLNSAGLILDQKLLDEIRQIPDLIKC